jgi:3-deoxy-D-manno-octulosonic-acid transferase
VTGHTKYDAAPKVDEEVSRHDLRTTFFREIDDLTPIVTLGSARPGEEDVFLNAAAALLDEGKRLKVIVAPRHMEKVGYFADKLRKTTLRWARWSERGDVSSYDVLVLDVMGRLEEAYAVSRLAFIGGTLVDVGGHNPLEAAMYGAPVVVGPYTSVIDDVLDEMRHANALIELRVGENARPLLERVVNGESSLREIGERGCGIWLRHRGAAKRVVSVIEHE